MAQRGLGLGGGLGLLALLGAGRAVHAEEGRPWYVGLEVTQVSLVALEGGLPEDNLEPLLQVKQGDPLSLGEVRHDLEVLARVGQFASVEAHVSPWTFFDAEGQPQEGVTLEYRLTSPARLQRIRVQSSDGGAQRLVRDAIHISRGEPVFADELLPPLKVELETLLAASGWPDATVWLSLEAVEDAPGLVDLVVDLVPGPRRRYAEVDIIGELGISEARARRLLRRAGVAPGRPARLAALPEGRERLLAALTEDGERTGSLFSARRRWLEARVNIIHTPVPSGDRVSVIIDAGPWVEVDARGPGVPSGDALAEAMQIFPGDRVTASKRAEYERSLRLWYVAQGYRSAQVEVILTEAEGGSRLRAVATPGPLHDLQRIEVTGARTFSPAYVEGALLEAAPESLGQGFVTDEGIERALRGVEQFYRGQGFLEAELTLAGQEVSERQVTVLRREAPAPVLLKVEVREGPRTWLRSLAVEGGVDETIEEELVSKARARLVGSVDAPSPYLQARLEALRQEVVEAYRAAGYLNADATLEVEQGQSTISGEVRRVADARIRIDPGRQIYLRSLVVQGNQRTRRDVIEREVALEVGDPVTPEALSLTRGRLYELGVFRLVQPTLLGDDESLRDLIVSVEERPNILIETGGGVSTDQGVRVTGRVVHRNLGGRAWRLSSLGQIGYGWQGDGWQLELTEPVWKAALRYEAQGLPARGQTLIVEGLLNETQQQPAFRLSRRGITTGIQFARRNGLEALVDYHVQWRQLEDLDPGALVAEDPWYQLFADPADPALPSVWRYQGGPGLQLLYDQRDDRFNPSRGTFASGRMELNNATGDAEALSARLTLRAEQFVPLAGFTLHLGAIGGLGFATGGYTLPVEDRFTLGGANSLRGFALSTVGPANFTPRPELDYPDQIGPLLDATALRATSAQWIYTGGDTMAAISTELRAPLSRLGLAGWDTTQLVLFTDVGQVTFRDPDIQTRQSDDSTADPYLRVGAGFGVRVATPIGPASLELGFNPFPINAREEARVVPHISLGAL